MSKLQEYESALMKIAVDFRPNRTRVPRGDMVDIARKVLLKHNVEWKEPKITRILRSFGLTMTKNSNKS